MNRHEPINDAELPSSDLAEPKRFFHEPFSLPSGCRLHYTDAVGNEFSVGSDC